MNAIKAIYDGTGFIPLQPIPVKEVCEVIITFIEPNKDDVGTVPAKKNVSKKIPRNTIKGALKGKVWMSSEFNEPLEEMREYMV